MAGKEKRQSAAPAITPGAYGLNLDNYLNHAKGIASWAFTLDHKRIGLMYLYSTAGSFLLGGVLAVLVRMELFTPTKLFMTSDVYNQTFTLHGAVMIFLFILPGIPAAFGNFVLPLMLGAKDVALPRLNLVSFWLYAIGGLFAVASIILGSVDTGWTFYAPYSLQTNKAVIPIVFGAFIMGFSGIFTGLNFIVTIHKMRPPGMGWFKMPLLLWALYATAIIQVLATPVLGITLLLIIVERVMGVGFFDASLGGDPVMFQHFFWFYSHPAVYIMILPAMGVISEVVSTFSKKPVFGYHTVAYSSLAIAVLSFLVWGHHMFVSGQSTLMNLIFSALTYSVAIPSAIKVFNWMATMYKGSVDLRTPMCWALSFILLFIIGGLTGMFLGALAADVHLHSTYFVVAHFHYTMVGGTAMAYMAALHYWWPKIFGRMYEEKLGRISCAMVFVGFNVTFIPQFIMGTRGMPRRYHLYMEKFEIFHQISTLGTVILLIGFTLMAINLIRSLFKGKPAPSNPWGGATFEWRCASPPPHDNFDSTLEAGDPYDYTNMEYDPKTDNYFFKEPKPSNA